MKARVAMNGQYVEILVTFENGYAGEFEWAFRNDAGQKCYAGLAAQALHVQFSTHMSAVRSAAYERGWKDAKARRAKCTWFSGCWT